MANFGITPFSFTDREGNKASLVNSLITGEGAAFTVGATSSPLIIKSGPKTPISPSVDQEGILTDYSEYYKRFYDAGGVDRHLSAVLGGGRSVFYGRDEEGQFITTEKPNVLVVDPWSVIWQGILDSRVALARVGIKGGDLGATMRNMLMKALAPLGATGETVEVLDISLSSTMLRWGHLNVPPDATGGTTLGHVVKYTWPVSTSSIQPLVHPISELLNEGLKPGWVLCTYLYPTGEGGAGDAEIFRYRVFRAKVVNPTRLATLKLNMTTSSLSTAYTTDGTQRLLPRYTAAFSFANDMWITTGSGASVKLGLRPGIQSATSGQFRTGYLNSGVPSGEMEQVTAPSIPASFGLYADGASQGQSAWYFPSSVTKNAASAGGVQTWPIPSNSTTFLQKASELLALDDVIEWGGITTIAEVVRDAYIMKNQLVPIGCDLAANPLVDYRIDISQLPAKASLVAALASPSTIASIRTRTSSERVGAALELADNLATESLLTVRSQMAAVKRDFYAIVGSSIAPPVGVLARTKIQQDAQEAGESIYEEIFLPKDDDDVNSRAVTFKTADNACNSFRAKSIKGGRMGIVVAGPTLRFSTDHTHMFVHWDGEAFFASTGQAAGSPAATEEELIRMYAGFVRGTEPMFAASAIASPIYVQYTSPFGTPDYPAQFDLVSDVFFGASWGSITAGPVGEGDKLYSVLGQLTDSGWLKSVDRWSAEFWLTTCASKNWQIESLLGALMTNPYGVGAFTHDQLAAIADEEE